VIITHSLLHTNSGVCGVNRGYQQRRDSLTLRPVEAKIISFIRYKENSNLISFNINDYNQRYKYFI